MRRYAVIALETLCPLIVISSSIWLFNTFRSIELVGYATYLESNPLIRRAEMGVTLFAMSLGIIQLVRSVGFKRARNINRD
jgi:hypothetical protein